MAARRLTKGFQMMLKHWSTHEQLQRDVKPIVEAAINFPEIEYNIDYVCNPANRNTIYNNIKKRGKGGDIDKVLELSQQPNSCDAFFEELNKIPNTTDPNVLEYGKEAKILKECGTRPTFSFKPRDLQSIAGRLKAIKNEQLGPIAGQRAYAFIGGMADLEQALINYSLDILRKHNFQVVSVPDILPTELIKRCGLMMQNERTLVYELENVYNEHLSLSGTAEMALAYLLMNKKFKKDELPLKLAAVSRCFRVETSSLAKERGLYRVHQFTKVEMFVCCDQEQSFDFFDKIIGIQEEIFNGLELWFKVLDMPPHELGSPAYRKVDIEGWMPGRQVFGELTSCSNCTDYQARRLNIKYENADGILLHVHTLNGTACAIPRSIIAIVEKYQTVNGNIQVPAVLIPYMNGQNEITGEGIPEVRAHKYNPRK